MDDNIIIMIHLVVGTIIAMYISRFLGLGQCILLNNVKYMDKSVQTILIPFYACAHTLAILYPCMLLKVSHMLA